MLYTTKNLKNEHKTVRRVLACITPLQHMSQSLKHLKKIERGGSSGRVVVEGGFDRVVDVRMPHLELPANCRFAALFFHFVLHKALDLSSRCRLRMSLP